jgi:hypothetical protein
MTSYFANSYVIVSSPEKGGVRGGERVEAFTPPSLP